MSLPVIDGYTMLYGITGTVATVLIGLLVTTSGKGEGETPKTPEPTVSSDPMSSFLPSSLSPSAEAPPTPTPTPPPEMGGKRNHTKSKHKKKKHKKTRKNK